MSTRNSRANTRDTTTRAPRSQTRVVRRAVSSPPVITVAPRARRKVGNQGKSDFLGDTVQVLTKSLNDPNVLMILAITTLICFTHISDTNNGPLATLVTKLKANESTQALGDWLGTNIMRMVGFIIFLPTIFSLPKTKRMMTAIISAAWVFFIPESSILQYSLQAILLLLFHRLPKAGDRLILLGVLVVTYALGNINLLVPVAKVAVSAANKTGKGGH